MKKYVLVYQYNHITDEWESPPIHVDEYDSLEGAVKKAEKIIADGTASTVSILEKFAEMRATPTLHLQLSK